MEHFVHGTAESHEWRSIRITELHPAGSDAKGSLVEVDVPAAVRHPVARSTRCQSIYYCVDGALDFRVGDAQLTVGPGDVVVIQPGEWYAYENRGPDSVRLLSLSIPPYDPAATEVRDETEDR